MKIITYFKESKVRLFIAILFTLSFAIPVLAKMTPAYSSPSYLAFQLDPGDKIIIRQNGIRVGEVYAPIRNPEDTHYIEHWVLYDNFVNVGKDRSTVTTFETARDNYKDETDFFARVRWGSSFRYVHVECTETDKLPGR